MQTEQLLCWSGLTDTEHSTTSSSNEEEEQSLGITLTNTEHSTTSSSNEEEEQSLGITKRGNNFEAHALSTICKNALW